MFYSIYSVTLHFDKFHDTALIMWIKFDWIKFDVWTRLELQNGKLAYSCGSFEGYQAINEMQEALESVGICKSIEQINNSLTWETHQQQTTWNYGLQQRLFVYCTPKSVWTLLRIIGLVK